MGKISGSSSSFKDDKRKIEIPRSSQKRQRAIYIKMRPVLGIDLAEVASRFELESSQLAQGITEAGLLHWALEVGPWTIELGKSRRRKEVEMRVTHVQHWDSSWETELERRCVGTTMLLDEQIMRPGKLLREHLVEKSC